MTKKILEVQGPEIIPDDLKDEVYILNDAGELIELEVPDDKDCDAEC